MRTIFNRVVLITLLIVGVTSCLKMPNDLQNPNLTEGISGGFDWKTTKQVTLTLQLPSDAAYIGTSSGVIRLYNSPSMSRESLVAVGEATSGLPFKSTISLAKPVKELYATLQLANGTTTTTVIPLDGPVINRTLESKSGKAGGVNSPIAAAAPNYPTIVIPTNFDVTINGNDSFNPSNTILGENSAINDHYAYLIPAGETRSVGIAMDNWQTGNYPVLYVAGKLNIPSTSLEIGNASLVVLSGGEVVIDKLSSYGTFAKPIIYIEEGGKLTFNGKAETSTQTVIVNHGEIVVANKLIIGSQGALYNSGEIVGANTFIELTSGALLQNSNSIAVKKVELNNNTTVTNWPNGEIECQEWYQTNNTILNNHGKVEASLKFYNGGGGEVNNHCTIITDQLDIQSMTLNLFSGSVISSSYFKANNSQISMEGGSLFITETVDSGVYKLTVEGENSGSYALFKVTNSLPQYTTWLQSSFGEEIELLYEALDESERNSYQGWVTAPAILTSQQVNNIPGCDCNGSLGSLGSWDYFPAQGEWGTFLFEDLWPAKGDYDMNDLVIQFRFSREKDKNNKVIRVLFDYQIMAVGASNDIALAFQLDNLTASDIESVEGQSIIGNEPFNLSTNGTEVGVAKAVIPLFNTPHDVENYIGYLNTDPAQNKIETTPKQVEIIFATPLDETTVTMGSLNLFITINDRGAEIHLPTFKATSKFNSNLLIGALLNPSDIYKSIDNMMWGLMIPKPFDYPSEKNSIIDAYLNFKEWAKHNGEKHQDWYENKPGNRNEELIY